MVKGTGQVFPAGPPLVSRALSYNIEKEELGGTKMHTRETGVVDNEAQDEEDFRTVTEDSPDTPGFVTVVIGKYEVTDNRFAVTFDEGSSKHWTLFKRLRFEPLGGPPPPKADKPLTKEERKRQEERLRALGYLE